MIIWGPWINFRLHLDFAYIEYMTRQKWIYASIEINPNNLAVFDWFVSSWISVSPKQFPATLQETR